MARLLPRASRPSRRARRMGLAVSGIGALAVTAGLVWQSAYAAFTETTPSYTLTWSTGTGTVAIADDDAGSVMFSASGLRPGATQTRCITVTSTGRAPSVVRLYGAGRTTSKSLSSYLTIVVSGGTGGSSASCVGFVPTSTVYRGTLAAFPTTYAAGIGSWTTAGNPAGETTSYQITYGLAASAPVSAQGGTAAVAFTWEAQNT